MILNQGKKERKTKKKEQNIQKEKDDYQQMKLIKEGYKIWEWHTEVTFL